VSTGLACRVETIRGVDYVPSNAVNATQMWLEFDAATIDRELGFAEALGLNSVRVFIQYLAHEHDAAGLLDRFDALLELASRHGLSVMPVLFDDCWLPEPFLGNQAPEPRPGLHNPHWQSSPGRRRMGLAFRPALRRYVEDLLGRFGRDRRIFAWDLYNEPQARDYTVALVRDVFVGSAHRAGAAPHCMLVRSPALRHHVDPLLRRPHARARRSSTRTRVGEVVRETGGRDRGPWPAQPR
jgi:hypothetical protein